MSMKKIKNIKTYKRRAIQLTELAIELVKNNDVELARRYVKLALLYSHKLGFKLPLEYRRAYCRKCYTPLVIGISERRRIKNKVLVRTCLYCGWTRRYKLQYETANKNGKG